DPARIGAGQIGAGNHYIGRKRAALISAKSAAMPLRGSPIGRLQPSPRDRDLGLPERAHQRPRSAAVPVADRRPIVVAFGRPSAITRPRQQGVELVVDQLLNEPAHPLADHAFQWIDPVVEKIGTVRRRLGYWLRNISRRGIRRHGVVSGPALQRRMIRGLDPRRLRHPQFQPTSRRHPAVFAYSLFPTHYSLFTISPNPIDPCTPSPKDRARAGWRRRNGGEMRCWSTIVIIA